MAAEETTGCAICGAAMVDVEKHANFHSWLDQMARTAADAESTADSALEKAEYSANVLYQRGID